MGQEVAWCQEALSSVLHATAKKIRIGARSKRWWNAHIKERRRTFARERRRRRNSEEAARAEVELQKSIWRSQRQMWTHYLNNFGEAKVW